MKRLIPIFSVLAVMGLVSGSVWAQDQAPAAKAATPAVKPKAAAAAHSSSDPALLHPSTLKAQAPAEYDVNFVTTKGDFVIHVTRAWAPNGADRFYNLVKHHFYDGASFFRFVDGFVVQFGLTGNPAVNKAWTNANIKDDPVKQSNKAGYITFAMAGKDTRTTQIFINLGDNSRLDTMGFSVFGQVTSGMDVVKSLYSGYADAPTEHQEEITNQGKAYLDRNFPKLDSIKTATIVAPTGAAPAAGSAPAHKPAAAATAKPKQP